MEPKPQPTVVVKNRDALDTIILPDIRRGRNWISGVAGNGYPALLSFFIHLKQIFLGETYIVALLKQLCSGLYDLHMNKSFFKKNNSFLASV